MTEAFLIATVVASVAAGCVGGAFYGFSTIVMPGLARLPAAQGVAAMQAINVAAVRVPFMVAFMGTAPLSIVLGARGIATLGEPAGLLLVVASALYLVGAFGVTIATNVPINNAVDRADATAPETAQLWARLSVRWTRLNHLRTLAALAAAGVFAAAATVAVAAGG